MWVQGNLMGAGKALHGSHLAPSTSPTAPLGGGWCDHRVPHWGLWLPRSRPICQRGGWQSPSACFHLTPRSSLGTDLSRRPLSAFSRASSSASAVTQGHDHSAWRQRRLSRDGDMGREKTSLAISKASARASPEPCVSASSSP